MVTYKFTNGFFLFYQSEQDKKTNSDFADFGLWRSTTFDEDGLSQEIIHMIRKTWFTKEMALSVIKECAYVYPELSFTKTRDYVELFYAKKLK